MDIRCRSYYHYIHKVYLYLLYCCIVQKMMKNSHNKIFNNLRSLINEPYLIPIFNIYTCTKPTVFIINNIISSIPITYFYEGTALYYTCNSMDLIVYRAVNI